MNSNRFIFENIISDMLRKVYITNLTQNHNKCPIIDGLDESNQIRVGSKFIIMVG